MDGDDEMSSKKEPRCRHEQGIGVACDPGVPRAHVIGIAAVIGQIEGRSEHQESAFLDVVSEVKGNARQQEYDPDDQEHDSFRRER